MNFPTLDYRKSVFTLTNYLQQLQSYSQKLYLANLRVKIDDTLEHLETNSFTIGVFGNFNCGKSTFINAFIGQHILPTDILATTATISRIVHRATPGATICFKDGSKQNISLEQLADFVTKLTSDAEKKAESLQESIIYYPIPYYQNQLEIIDTPGLNDDGEMTAITSEFIEHCDVAIMLISAISPFGITEGEFLTTKLLANGITKILFVVNFIDLLNPADIEKIIKLISDRIEQSIQAWAEQQPHPQEILDKLGKIQIHGISAFQALEAKATRNIPLLAQSWFVNFECALRTVINQERGLIQLQTTCDRTTTYATEILSHVKHQESELAVEISQLNKAKETINHRVNELRRQKAELMISFNHTLSNIKKQANFSDSLLQTQLKAAAKSTISSTEFTIDKQSDIAKLILTAVQKATNDVVKQIQSEIINSSSLCLIELKKFIQLCEQFINDLELDNHKILEIISLFNQYNHKLSQLKSLSVSFPGNSEIFCFTQEASGVGTAAGAAIGFFILGPIGGGIGAAIGAAAGGNQRTNKFKENYPIQVMAVIENQLKTMHLNQQVAKYISEVFSPIEKLENLLVAEVNLMLNDMQNQLAEYCGKQEVINQTKQQYFSQIQVEITKIISDMKNFSQQLSQISA